MAGFGQDTSGDREGERVGDELADTTPRLTEAIRGRLIAAPVTPMDESAHIAPADLDRYAAAIAGAVDGVCVWAHTARGLELTDTQRDAVLAAFRAATDGPLLAAVGPPAGTGDDFASQCAATARLAERAAAGGADALMVYPVSSLRAPDTRAERTIRLHAEVAAAAGLPVTGFLLYPEAGGVSYPPALLTELAARPEVFGVKLATLYDAVACQDAIAAIHAGGALAITGEDRMFGPSLLWGADAALVGVAAAVAELSARLVHAWFAGETAAFVVAARRLDRFAAAVFRDPMDGYVQRMLWAAEREGIIPAASAHDPHGVRPDPVERAAVAAAYRDAVGG
jgi:4-hydroxy-tetrahydrodipicolinate synthase